MATTRTCAPFTFQGGGLGAVRVAVEAAQRLVKKPDMDCMRRGAAGCAVFLRQLQQQRLLGVRCDTAMPRDASCHRKPWVCYGRHALFRKCALKVSSVRWMVRRSRSMPAFGAVLPPAVILFLRGMRRNKSSASSRVSGCRGAMSFDFHQGLAVKAAHRRTWPRCRDGNR